MEKPLMITRAIEMKMKLKNFRRRLNSTSTIDVKPNYKSSNG